jgi:bacterioferritin-associated ferredoxin|tara:strand:+ start:1064 stop:1228 length:165 start_codon:yes stop_codon:yes gene_type:complete
MYLCICGSVTVEEAEESNATTLVELRDLVGACTGCMTCIDECLVLLTTKNNIKE